MHFVANRQRNLAGGLGPGLIIADEAPLKNRDRTGEHSFHRLPGLRLREFGPAHGHRLGPFHVTKKDRRLDAARAVTLYPAVFSESEPTQLFAEILDHVGSFKLAVN